jgi:hypothetical protein
MKIFKINPMKSAMLPLAAGAIIGSLSVLAWQDIRSSDVAPRSEVISVSAKEGADASKFSNMRAVNATSPGTIADVDEKLPNRYPNLRRLMLLDELKQNKKLNISIPIVNESGKFHLNFKELFDLTDDQVSDIEGNIRMLRMQMTAEMSNHARVTKEHHKTIIEIPPNESAVGYYDKFMDMMQEYLGGSVFRHFFIFLENSSPLYLMAMEPRS